MKANDIDRLLESLEHRGATRRAAADAALDRRLADAIRRGRRPYELAATALPLALLLAAAVGAPATAPRHTTSVVCNNACSADAVMADANSAIEAWING